MSPSLGSDAFGQPAGSCRGADGGIITTCADWLLHDRLTRSLGTAPERAQMTGRLSGSLRDPMASGGTPVLLTPAEAEKEAIVETSLSRWRAHLDRRALEKANAAKAGAEGELPLPAPPPPAVTSFDVWTRTKVEGPDPQAPGRGLTSHIGADYALGKSAVLGALVEIEEDRTGNHAWQPVTAEREAFLVGPYLAFRVAPNLVLDAKTGWGQGSDRLPGDEVTLSASRHVSEARLTGHWDWNAWRIAPTASIVHASETPAAGAGAAAVETRTVSISPEVRRSVNLEGGTVLEPFLAYRSSLDLGAMTGGDGLEAGLDKSRAVGGGLSLKAPDSFELKATADLEGLGRDPADRSVKSRVELKLPLN